MSGVVQSRIGRSDVPNGEGLRVRKGCEPGSRPAKESRPERQALRRSPRSKLTVEEGKRNSTHPLSKVWENVGATQKEVLVRKRGARVSCGVMVI